jgi:RHS repeat-associated protein
VYIGDYAVITSGGGNPRKVEYLLKDRLGSVDAVANASGAVTETRGYDAFGKPRGGTWADLNPAKLASTNVTPKGFTQHEHLNQLELIHMNGRVFDYNVGRFTGVDPFIQFPLNSQSLNPYSYILNNPLSGTDPTGYASSCGDVSTSKAGSGSCNYTTSDGKEHSVDYKVGKDGKVSISTSASSFGSIAADNRQRGRNGGVAPKGVTDAGRKEAAAAFNDKGVASNMASSSQSNTGGNSNDRFRPQIERNDDFSSGPRDEEGGIFDSLGDYFTKWYRDFIYPDEINDPVILSAFRKMWSDSLPEDENRRHEEGLYWGKESKDGSRGVRRWPSSRSRTQITPPQLEPGGTYMGLIVEGDAHTHPNPRPIDEFGRRWFSKPSVSDIEHIRGAGYPGKSYIIDNVSVILMESNSMWYIMGTHEDVLGEKK